MTESTTLDRIASGIDELEPILTSVVVNDTAILDALSQLLGALHQMQMKSEHCQNRVAEELRTLRLKLETLEAELHPARQPILIAANPLSNQDAEVGLLEYLYSFLSDTNAIDVGANVGRVSERLLLTGYTVYAFEPYPEVFKTLQQNLSENEKFHGFQCALGSSDCTMNLHVAVDLSGTNKWDPTLFNSLIEHPMLEDCRFATTVPVQVRSLESLRQKGEIPASAGLLKIDTEGFDLDVVRGMGNARFSVVMMEFWDPDHPFGRSGHGRLEDSVVEMKTRGYNWHIVIYHVDETSTISYYCNRVQTVPKSWGNVLFFAEHAIFTEALRWCGDVLAPSLYR